MNGIGVSPGIAIGKAFVIKKSEPVFTGIVLKGEEYIQLEIDKYDHAVSISIKEIEEIISGTDSTDHNIEILETQIEFLSDPQIKSDVVEKINNDKKSANDALIEVISDAVELLNNMDDEYISARATDMQDIGNRILKNLNRSFQQGHQKFENDTIIIAEDIVPSDTITMDMNLIIGFATQKGGRTSHTAIIAKSRGIPAIVGCGDGLMAINNNDRIILDGKQGLIIVNPDRDSINDYLLKREEYLERATLLRSLKDISATTTDGVEIKLLANVSHPDDMEDVFDNGGEGIGLLRTEMLFMARNTFPTEEEQFSFYKEIALKSRNKPVTIRTIDIGGDKQLPYFGLPHEQNPFLGYRAIRICLDRKDMFITQLKGILRASVFGKFKIMFPMICNVQEFRSAKEVFEEAKNELLMNNIVFDKNIEIGIMIEVPSAAITADILAKEVDFFSIGTNDLCQYTLAVDRMNENVKDLYDPFDPGVLRLINYVIEQADKNKIHVALCGELASEPLATRLLLGMGLREFSMSAGSIPSIKNIVINHSILSTKEICTKVMGMDTSKSILEYLKEVSA